MGKKLLKCPKCGWTYNDNNTKRFGWYRVYSNEHHPKEFLHFVCRKCKSKFKVYLDQSKDKIMYNQE